MSITKSETAQLLVLVTALDRRTTGETDVEAWHLILGDLEHVTIADCAEAVRDHYRERREFLMPADVVTRATAHARRRLGRERAAELERQRLAEEEADRLAIAGAPPVDREQLAARLKAATAKSRPLGRAADPRHDRAGLEQARREVAELAGRTVVAVNVQPVEEQAGSVCVGGDERNG